MTKNPHQIMFSYWEMVISTKITRSKPLLLCCQHKLNIWQLHNQQGKQCGFHHFLGTSVFTKWNPLSYMMTIKVVYLYQITNISCLHKAYQDSSSFGARKFIKNIVQVTLHNFFFPIHICHLWPTSNGPTCWSTPK
jgi:hypothetical protein